MNSLCVQNNPSTKGHLCITAPTLSPKVYAINTVSLYLSLIAAQEQKEFVYAIDVKVPDDLVMYTYVIISTLREITNINIHYCIYTCNCGVAAMYVHVHVKTTQNWSQMLRHEANEMTE